MEVVVIEFCAAVNLVGGNITFKKRASQLVTYHCGLLKTQVDYWLVRGDQRKFVKDVKVLPSEECITQHIPLVSEDVCTR